MPRVDQLGGNIGYLENRGCTLRPTYTCIFPPSLFPPFAVPHYKFDMAQRGGKKKSSPIDDQNEDMLGSKGPAALQFLTFTHVDQITDPETKRKVRSHVMHGVQKKLRSRKGEERSKETRAIILDISSLSKSHPGSSASFQILPQPGSLGSGQSDPFKQYPIAMNVRAHELYDHRIDPLCQISIYFLLSSASAWQDLPNVQDAEQDWILPHRSG